MAQLSKFLGITYQSYQAMEKGGVSFRVSTLERLAIFYSTTIADFIGSDAPGSRPNMDRVSYLVNLISGMSAEHAGDVVRFAAGKARESGAKR
jgi:transcriptional regulator with XRE-family HTH domain